MTGPPLVGFFVFVHLLIICRSESRNTKQYKRIIFISCWPFWKKKVPYPRLGETRRAGYTRCIIEYQVWGTCYVTILFGKSRSLSVGEHENVFLFRSLLSFILRWWTCSTCSSGRGRSRGGRRRTSLTGTWTTRRKTTFLWPSPGGQEKALNITGEHSIQNQIWSVKLEGCMGLWVRGLHLLSPP